MRVVVEGVPTVEDRFASEAELMDRYRAEEAANGRVVPSFLWEEMAVAVVTFLLEYAGTKSLDALLHRRAKRRAGRERDDPEATRRQATVDRLDSIAERLDAIERQLQQARPAEVLPMLSEAGVHVVVELETPAEASLLEELRGRLDGSGVALVLVGHGVTDEAAAAARELIDANRYMTLATADAEGRPWAAPVWYAHERWTDFYWVSRPEARHSRNLAARPALAIVIFDSTVPVGAARAVYVEAVGEELRGAELERGIAVFSRRSLDQGAEAWLAADVLAPAPHRLYRASASEHSVLDAGDRRTLVRVG